MSAATSALSFTTSVTSATEVSFDVAVTIFVPETTPSVSAVISSETSAVEPEPLVPT
ncbi:MAG: hypothetical protein IJP62_10545 [Treponema sp.]|nr:hypothetical protein [Treponema sp.]